MLCSSVRGVVLGFVGLLRLLVLFLHAGLQNVRHQIGQHVLLASGYAKWSAGLCFGLLGLFFGPSGSLTKSQHTKKPQQTNQAPQTTIEYTDVQAGNAARFGVRHF